jgi:hypothetical protein
MNGFICWIGLAPAKEGRAPAHPTGGTAKRLERECYKDAPIGAPHSKTLPLKIGRFPVVFLPTQNLYICCGVNLPPLSEASQYHSWPCVDATGDGHSRHEALDPLS